jgi:hypothetical protein
MNRQRPRVDFLAPLLTAALLLSSAHLTLASQQSKTLYDEGVIYRTKVENTNTYAKQLWVLVDAGIEHTPQTTVDQRITELRGTTKPSPTDTALSILSKAPGYVGKIGDALQMYNSVSRAADASASNGSQMGEDTEHSARRALAIVHTLSEKDPEFAKLIDHYLEATFGPINGTEDQILDANPQFKQFLDVQKIKALASDEKDQLQTIQAYVNDIRQKLEEEDKAKADAAAYQDRQKAIEEWTAYGALLGRLVAFSNPGLGRTLNAAVAAYNKGATLMNQLNHWPQGPRLRGRRSSASEGPSNSGSLSRTVACGTSCGFVSDAHQRIPERMLNGAPTDEHGRPAEAPYYKST